MNSNATICQALIEGLVREYTDAHQTEYCIKKDGSPTSLNPREVSLITYPSIMLLVDKEARQLGFEGSQVRFKIEPHGSRPFPLKADSEPKLPMSVLLPFVLEVCDRELAKEPVLSKVFENAIRTVIPDFTLNQTQELVASEDFGIHGPA